MSAARCGSRRAQIPSIRSVVRIESRASPLRLGAVTRVIREDAAAVVERLGARLDALAGRRLLVTGAGGFLCSHLLDVVAAWNDQNPADACRVLAVDVFHSGLPERLAHLVGPGGRPEFDLLRADVAKPLDAPGRFDLVVHGASIASPPVYRERPLETIDANVLGTRQMLELARSAGATSMVFLSTSEIYGDPDAAAIPTPETYRGNVSCTGPRACYDESKRLGETLCTTYQRKLGTPVKIVRPFNVYGPGQRLDDGRIVPDLVGAALRREPLVLWSDGRATRAFCYVRDAVRGLLEVLLLGRDGEAYNLGNDQAETSVRELAFAMREVAGPPPLAVRFATHDDADYLTDNPSRRCPDLAKLRALSGYAPEVDLKTGLERTLRSYRALAAEALGGANG
jgi:dTDP-glucose 4,6-dehydratase/UDP-glucuronate decarboxylase